MEEKPSALTPFPTSVLTPVTKGPYPLLSIKRNTIQIGEAHVWLGNLMVQTPLHWDDTEIVPLTLELVAVNLAHWSYDLMPGSIIRCLKCACILIFFPELISSYNIWWQCLHGSVVLSLITNSTGISSHRAWSAHALPEEAQALYSSVWLQVIWYL